MHADGRSGMLKWSPSISFASTRRDQMGVQHHLRTVNPAACTPLEASVTIVQQFGSFQLNRSSVVHAGSMLRGPPSVASDSARVRTSAAFVSHRCGWHRPSRCSWPAIGRDSRMTWLTDILSIPDVASAVSGCWPHAEHA